MGDRVSITSDSKVYLNSVGNRVADEVERGDKSDCDRRDLNEVGNCIRNSKDLPKLKSRIFEDSVESQEISFYIGMLMGFRIFSALYKGFYIYLF